MDFFVNDAFTSLGTDFNEFVPVPSLIPGYLDLLLETNTETSDGTESHAESSSERQNRDRKDISGSDSDLGPRTTGLHMNHTFPT